MTAKILAPLRFLADWLVRFIEDDGLASAGYLAYIGLMSLLPFLVFVFTLLGLVGQADQGAGIVDAMFRFMPTEVALTLHEPVVQVVGRASGGVLTLSLIVVLWITASGVEGIRTALNRAYRTRETRSYWRRRANSSALVVFFRDLSSSRSAVWSSARCCGTRRKPISILAFGGALRISLKSSALGRGAGRCLSQQRRCITHCRTGSRRGLA